MVIQAGRWLFTISARKLVMPDNTVRGRLRTTEIDEFLDKCDKMLRDEA